MMEIHKKIENLLIDKEEIDESTELCRRLIKRLSNLPNQSYQYNMDILENITDYRQTCADHKMLAKQLRKEIIDMKSDLKRHNPDLLQEVTKTQEESEEIGNLLSTEIDNAEDKIENEKMNITNRLEEKHLQYWYFRGTDELHDKNIYEVLQNHERNHKLQGISEKMKGYILKEHLKTPAKDEIPDDKCNYQEIKTLLLQRYGDKIDLLWKLQDHHGKIGKVPPRTGENVKWKEVAENCKQHLTLLRKAEKLINNTKDTEGVSFINRQVTDELQGFLCNEDRVELIPFRKMNTMEVYNRIEQKFKDTSEFAEKMIKESFQET